MPPAEDQCEANKAAGKECKCDSAHCSANKPIEETLKSDEFKKQLHKWGHHHHLPQWAEDQLVEHVKHEIDRRKQADKYSTRVDNLVRPWRWQGIWHQTHMHEGDIAFPKHAPLHVRHHLSPNQSPNSHSPKKSPVASDKPAAGPQSPKSPSEDDLTLMEVDDEVLMTDDLIHEIMDDDDPDCPTEIIEHAGVDGIDVWIDKDRLRERNHLFSKAKIHENTIRSIALVNPKPGDPRPGKTKLNSAHAFGYDINNTKITFDDTLVENHGIYETETIDMKNYKKK